MCEHHLINFGVTNKLSMQFIAIILCLIWVVFWIDFWKSVQKCHDDKILKCKKKSIKTGLTEKRTAILDKVCYYIKKIFPVHSCLFLSQWN